MQLMLKTPIIELDSFRQQTIPSWSSRRQRWKYERKAWLVKGALIQGECNPTLAWLTATSSRLSLDATRRIKTREASELFLEELA